jgi:tryptophanyl-tRNA synthetase
MAEKTEEREDSEAAEQVVTPWEVAAKGGIDYDKLIVQFGCQRLDTALVERVERLTGRPAHPFLRRGVFFAHRSGPSPISLLFLKPLYPKPLLSNLQ